MKNRFITIECDQTTMDTMEHYAFMDNLKPNNGHLNFWEAYGFKHCINGETLYFLKKEWDEYKRDWKGTPGCDS